VSICDADTTTLKMRMARYRARQGSGTNERVADDILRSLMARKAVTIHALLPGDQGCRYKGVSVDLVKGLENPLIRELQL